MEGAEIFLISGGSLEILVGFGLIVGGVVQLLELFEYFAAHGPMTFCICETESQDRVIPFQRRVSSDEPTSGVTEDPDDAKAA
jgi:hypothetical protein